MSTPAQTRTGDFPVGVRQGWTDWQKDLPGFLGWLKANRFAAVDLGKETEAIPAALAQGFRIGSVDLADWSGMISPDAATRAKAVEKNAAQIAAAAKIAGPLSYFIAMIPEKPELPRLENFGYMVESFRLLAPVFEAHQSHLVIEGWPGDGVLCCTPESYGAFFRECPSPAMGINYDPSHLIRMEIDPIRFLKEFVGRVRHVHGKDTQIFEDDLYFYGNTQASTLGKKRGFGELYWRYTVPGHGRADWGQIFRILSEAGYRGAVSVELEDENFNGTNEGEKQGLLLSRDFLVGC